MFTRVTSEVWVSALIRKIQATGGFCAVLKKGAEAAGAIFVCHRHLSENVTTLYGPAPQAILSDVSGSKRQFEQVLDRCTEPEVNAYLEKQRKFDPDIWIVEIESTEDCLDLNME